MPETPGFGLDDEHDHEHAFPPFQERNIADLYTTDGSNIRVDHLYVASADLQPCPSCGGECVSPGLIGLVLDEESAVLSPEETLLLINRLQRTVNAVLETMEDPPDMDREAARLALPRSGPDQP
jgi:hypothetical protein